jgi:uncharacterized protein YqfA (UPF0365 family)
MSDPKEMTVEELARIRQRVADARRHYGGAMFDENALLDHADALAARVKKAELDREDWRGSAQIWKDDHDAQKARADAAEKKLEALVEARRAEVEAGVRLALTEAPLLRQGYLDASVQRIVDNAIRTARGGS